MPGISTASTLQIRENVQIRDYTTFRVGGPGRFFCEVTSENELLEALLFAEKKTNGIFFILGGGSNILVSDEGFNGLIIRINILGINFGGKVTVSAGENWDDFVKKTILHSLYGLENLSGIPGTVGGALVQNSGAYGVEVGQKIESVRAYDTKEKKWRTFTKEECQFSYRESIFKKKSVAIQPGIKISRYIITLVTFSLETFVSEDITPLNLDYKDIKDFFSAENNVSTGKKSGEKLILEKVTPIDIRNAVLAIRSRKLPDIQNIGTAGSFFKNPIIALEKYQDLKKHYPDLPSFFIDEKTVKLPLGWILDHICGYKGLTKGSVGIYKNQALVIVNKGGALAQDIKEFAADITSEVKVKTGIEIEPEVHYL